MPNFGENAAKLTLIASLAASGCSDPQNQEGLAYSPDPNEAFGLRASDCYRDRNSWALHIDGDVLDIEEEGVTIGLYGNESDFAVGVIVRGLGGGAYEIATSEDDAIHIEDIREDDFARVLESSDPGFAAVLSGRYDQEDDRAYFRLSCLPDFDFHGDSIPVPLEEVPHEIVPAQPTEDDTMIA